MLKRLQAWSRGDLDPIRAELSGIGQGIATVAGQVDSTSEAIVSLAARLDELVERQKVFPISGIASLVERSYENRPESELYEALFGGSDSVRGAPAALGMRSSVCKQLHFSLDEFRFWTHAMGRKPRLHRKEWEWFYIAQILFERKMLQEGRKGLVFAVGQEPLPSLFAKYGCDILATDQAPDDAHSSGWASTAMYSSDLRGLHHANIVSWDDFTRRVAYQHADMNRIDGGLDNRFDFCWSSCAFEHLGSIEAGIAFVVNSMKTLKRGGIAIHTTEFNLQSNSTTYESAGLSLYRRKDIEELISRLEAEGHAVEPVDWNMGPGLAEIVTDTQPHKQSPHLRLEVYGYACTSIGLIITKRG